MHELTHTKTQNQYLYLSHREQYALNNFVLTSTKQGLEN
jgi:hypothetical protein